MQLLKRKLPNIIRTKHRSHFFNHQTPFFLLIALLLAFSCNKNQQLCIDEIDLSNAPIKMPIKLSTIADSIEFVLLESSNESFFADVRDIVVTNKYIVISDDVLHNLLLFSRDGCFLRKIGNFGKGPGEFIDLFAITVYEETNSTFIFTLGSKLLHYNFEGQHLNTYQMKDMPASKIHAFQNEIVALIPYPSSIISGNFSFATYNLSSKMTKKYLYRPSEEIKGTIVGPRSWNYYRKSITFWEIGCDTIYNYNPRNGLNPVYLLKVPNNAITQLDHQYPEILTKKV